MTLMLSVIILTDSPIGGEGLQEAKAGQESLESCDNPRELLGVTGSPRSRAVV